MIFFQDLVLCNKSDNGKGSREFCETTIDGLLTKFYLDGIKELHTDGYIM